MKNLINFLIRYSVFILFLLLETVSFILILNHREYQKSILFSTFNNISSSVYSAGNSVVEFLRMKDANELLSEENAALKSELINLKEQLVAVNYENDTLHSAVLTDEYKLISAKVIYNSTNKIQNYIRLNKGRNDGVYEDMGVIGDQGIVGIVTSVSDHFSVVIPLLNSKLQVSAKFKQNNYSGSLCWNGTDYRYAKLTDIARHVHFSKGDSIVTSGYTTSFPEGLLIGTVENFQLEDSDAYYNIDVKLATNFRTITHVRLIGFLHHQELDELSH